MENLRAFGLRVKELRTLKKLTQDQLAEMLDINSKYLSRIEMGYSFPSFDVLSKIADALEVLMLEIIDFSHAGKTTAELRKEMRRMVEQASDEKLPSAYRTLKAAVR